MVRTVEVTIPGAQGATGSIPGATEFTQLTDTPSTYSGHGQKVVRVNAGETALEFTAPPRTRLTADTTFYVRTDGSNSNNGLTNTAGGAWLTPTYAYDWICANIDGAGYDIIIQLADGTYSHAGDYGWYGIYTSGPSIYPTGSYASNYVSRFTGQFDALQTSGIIMMRQAWYGARSITFRGNNTTPTNCFLSNDHGCGINLCGFCAPGPVFVEGFKITALHEGIINTGNGTIVISGPTVFGNCGIAHVNAGAGSIACFADYTISGTAPRHWYADGGGIVGGLFTYNVTGAPTIGSMAESLYRGVCFNNGGEFSGSFTGREFRAETGGLIIDANGNGITTTGASSPGGWSYGQGIVLGREMNRQIFFDYTSTNTTLTAIPDDIIIGISANENKSFKWRIWYDTPTAADFKFDIAGPASPTKLSYVIRYAAPDDTSITTTGVKTAYNVVTTLTASTGTRGYVEIEGLVNNGANSGNMSFRFAQATASGTTSVLAGSDLWTNTMGGVS